MWKIIHTGSKSGHICHILLSILTVSAFKFPGMVGRSPLVSFNNYVIIKDSRWSVLKENGGEYLFFSRAVVRGQGGDEK